MIDSLKYEVKRILLKDRKYVSENAVNINLLFLLNLKYLCDSNKYTYDELLEFDSIDKLNITEENRLLSVGNFDVRILLPIIKHEDLKKLIMDFIKIFDNKPRLFVKDKKVLLYTTSFDYSLYDKMGKTTYVTDMFLKYSLGIAIFNFFDKVLEINNKYLVINDINIANYEYMYIYDFMPRYRFIRNSDNDIYRYIYSQLRYYKNINIVLHTDFKKIANVHDFRQLVKFIDKVLLYDEVNTYMLFKNKEIDSVSIIKYDKDKIKSLDRLNEIIDNNRKIKDILIKTTSNDIVNNHYRIGFKLYQNNLNSNKRNINEIVDENTELIERLASLNQTIEIEMNKLINR